MDITMETLVVFGPWTKTGDLSGLMTRRNAAPEEG